MAFGQTNFAREVFTAFTHRYPCNSFVTIKAAIPMYVLEINK